MVERALILGASGGIGAALMRHLRDGGTMVTGLSRSEGMDLTRPDLVRACAQKLGSARFDLIFNATGALEIDGYAPEKSIDQFDAQGMAAQFALNATGVAVAIQNFAPLLDKDAPHAIFASLSARIGSIGDNRLGGWISYRAAKAAQNQIIRTASIEMRRRPPNSIFVALHPGTVETPLTAKYAARHKTITAEESAQGLLRVIEGLGPDDSGSFWDWNARPITW